MAEAEAAGEAADMEAVASVEASAVSVEEEEHSQAEVLRRQVTQWRGLALLSPVMQWHSLALQCCRICTELLAGTV